MWFHFTTSILHFTHRDSHNVKLMNSECVNTLICFSLHQTNGFNTGMQGQIREVNREMMTVILISNLGLHKRTRLCVTSADSAWKIWL